MWRFEPLDKVGDEAARCREIESRQIDEKKSPYFGNT